LVDDDGARMRHGPVSPEQAREMQHKRILDAMVSEVGERGLRGVTIAGVSARAGVSRSTFYELFKDLDSCVLAVLRQVASRSTALMAKAFAEEDSWQDGVLAALAVLLESLDREPLLARVCLLEMLAGSPEVLEHRARELAALNPLVDVGRKQSRANGEPVELTAEASVASVAGILHTRLVTGEAPPYRPAGPARRPRRLPVSRPPRGRHRGQAGRGAGAIDRGEARIELLAASHHRAAAGRSQPSGRVPRALVRGLHRRQPGRKQ
jgi:AcrR family transcriptional regulator